MKVNELTPEIIADYIRLDGCTEVELREVDMMFKAALAYVKGYTGLDEDKINMHEDITIAVIVIVGDMFEGRNMYLDTKASTQNKTVECILGMHAINLL